MEYRHPTGQVCQFTRKRLPQKSRFLLSVHLFAQIATDGAATSLRTRIVGLIRIEPCAARPVRSRPARQVFGPFEKLAERIVRRRVYTCVIRTAMYSIPGSTTVVVPEWVPSTGLIVMFQVSITSIRYFRSVGSSNVCQECRLRPK